MGTQIYESQYLRGCKNGKISFNFLKVHFISLKNTSLAYLKSFIPDTWLAHIR